MKANIKKTARRTPRRIDIFLSWWRANGLTLFAAVSAVWVLAIFVMCFVRTTIYKEYDSRIILIFVPAGVYMLGSVIHSAIHDWKE